MVGKKCNRQKHVLARFELMGSGSDSIQRISKTSPYEFASHLVQYLVYIRHVSVFAVVG